MMTFEEDLAKSLKENMGRLVDRETVRLANAHGISMMAVITLALSSGLWHGNPEFGGTKTARAKDGKENSEPAEGFEPPTL